MYVQAPVHRQSTAKVTPWLGSTVQPGLRQVPARQSRDVRVLQVGGQGGAGMSVVVFSVPSSRLYPFQ